MNPAALVAKSLNKKGIFYDVASRSIERATGFTVIVGGTPEPLVSTSCFDAIGCIYAIYDNVFKVAFGKTGFDAYFCLIITAP